MKYSWIGALIIIALTIVFALLPWIAFWSIGALFGFAIPYTFVNCLAFWTLVIIMRAPQIKADKV